MEWKSQSTSTTAHFFTSTRTLALTRVLSLVYCIAHTVRYFSHTCPFSSKLSISQDFWSHHTFLRNTLTHQEIVYEMSKTLTQDIFLFLGQVCLVEKAVQCPMHSQHSPGRFERELDVIHTHTHTHTHTYTVIYTHVHTYTRTHHSL